MLNVIYDRTQADVDNKTAKGYYNAVDLNRVETAMATLATQLNALGFDISVTQHSWQQGDIPHASDMTAYMDTVRQIHDAFVALNDIDDAPVIPASAVYLDWRGANAIEKLLADVEALAELAAATVDFAWTQGVAHTGLYTGW